MNTHSEGGDELATVLDISKDYGHPVGQQPLNYFFLSDLHLYKAKYNKDLFNLLHFKKREKSPLFNCKEVLLYK